MATVLYGANGRALTGSANPDNFEAGSIAWTATGGTFPGVLTDASDATYMSALSAATLKTYRLNFTNEAALIPTGSTFTSADFVYRMKKSSPGATSSHAFYVYNGSFSFTSMPAGTTSFAAYTTNIPTDGSGAAWTIASFYSNASWGHAVQSPGVGTVFLSQEAIRLTVNLPTPAVTTNAATLVSSTIATLNATSAIASGAATTLFPITVSFEYGTTTAYGTTVVGQVFTSSSGVPQAVSVQVTGLSPSTLYHFRAKSANDDHTTLGSDMTFTTLAGDTPIMVL